MIENFISVQWWYLVQFGPVTGRSAQFQFGYWTENYSVQWN